MTPVSPGAPAPHNETKEYEWFNFWFFPLMLTCYGAVSYGFALGFPDAMLRYAVGAPWSFPMLSGYEPLDPIHTISYVATVLSHIILTPLFLWMNAHYYGKTVAFPKMCRRLTKESKRIVTPIIVLLLLFNGVFFFFPSKAIGWGNPSEYFLLWPFRPAWAGLIGACNVVFIFTLLVYRWKRWLTKRGDIRYFAEDQA